MMKPKVNVAIISISLAKGGAERFASLLSKMIEAENIAVHNIIINDAVDFDYKGKLYNLGTAATSTFSVFKKIEKGYLLYKYLKNNDIDVIVDNRPRNHYVRELLTMLIYGSRKKIFVIHSFNLKNYFPSPQFLSQKLYRNASKLVCVSNEIEQSIRQKFNFWNTITIYNPFEVAENVVAEKVSDQEKYILFFGRLDEKVKNFSLMLEAFSQSEIYKAGYCLYVLGEGPDLVFIQNKIKELELEPFIKILPFVKNPQQWVAKAKYTILTSRYEGFPMSLVESLALGTPVVAVDCKSGPKEIVKPEQNGLLVQNNNVQELSKAMKRMIEDEKLYNFCKKNASESVEHLSLDTISKQWKALILFDNND